MCALQALKKLPKDLQYFLTEPFEVGGTDLFNFKRAGEPNGSVAPVFPQVKDIGRKMLSDPYCPGLGTLGLRLSVPAPKRLPHDYVYTFVSGPRGHHLGRDIGLNHLTAGHILSDSTSLLAGFQNYGIGAATTTFLEARNHELQLVAKSEHGRFPIFE